MPEAIALRWIDIDDNAGMLALSFGQSGVVMLALKRTGASAPTMGYWTDEQGNLLGRVEAGQA